MVTFLFLEGVAPKQIHERLLKVYKDSLLSIWIERWAAEFKRGRTSLENDPRDERVKTATTLETERDLVETLGILLRSVKDISTSSGFQKAVYTICAAFTNNGIKKKHANSTFIRFGSTTLILN